MAAELIRFTGEDEEAFVEADIPTGGLVNDDEDEKSPEQARAWGGQAGVAFDRCYHAACDRLDQVNEVALDRFSRATAGAIAQFAAMNRRPTDRGLADVADERVQAFRRRAQPTPVALHHPV